MVTKWCGYTAMGIKLITLSVRALKENLGICFRRENKIQSLLWLKIAGRIVWCSISIIQLPNPGVFSHAHYSSQHAPTIHRQNNLHTISIGGATIYRQDYYCINNKGLPWCSFCVSHAGLFALCCSSWQLQRCSPVHKVGTKRKRRRMVRAGRPCCECVWNGGNFIFRLFGDSFNWNREIFLFSLDAFYVRKCFNRITEEESQLFTAICPTMHRGKRGGEFFDKKRPPFRISPYKKDGASSPQWGFLSSA